MKNYISKVIYYYDYIYYRIATGWIYGKSYKKYKMSYYSSAIVSILQYLIFFNALMTFILMKFSIADLNPTQQIVAIILAVIAGVHIQINNFHYKNNMKNTKPAGPIWIKRGKID